MQRGFTAKLVSTQRPSARYPGGRRPLCQTPSRRCGMSESTSTGRPILPRGLMILLGFAAATITVAGLKSIGGILGPAFLAIVLMITVFPIRGWLVRHKVPSWLATTLTI